MENKENTFFDYLIFVTYPPGDVFTALHFLQNLQMGPKS
jgi:hypothetical protein